MLLVDDLLASPFHGILWVLREIHQAALQELEGEEDSITEQLRLLYMELETGGIGEAEFTSREKTLLDRLDKIQGREEVEEAAQVAEEHPEIVQV